MSVSGMMMVMFVTVHLLGNSSIFAGTDGINVYAEKLRGLGPFVWLFRIIMIAVFSIHIFFGIWLTLENKSAKPETYKVKKDLSVSFASKNMVWTGLIIGAFLIYHLLHFTFHINAPGISSGIHLDATGRHDVFGMVVMSFRNLIISLIYILSMVALFLHLSHGIQSFFQTLGLNSDRTFPLIIKGGKLAAAMIFLGFISIPLVIFFGILRH